MSPVVGIQWQICETERRIGILEQEAQRLPESTFIAQGLQSQFAILAKLKAQLPVRVPYLGGVL